MVDESADKQAVMRETPSCLRRVRKRQGRCYELASRVVLRERGSGWTLIYGHLHAKVPSVPYSHAWLERDGEVYDPVQDLWFSITQFVMIYEAVIDHSYSAKKAAVAVAWAVVRRSRGGGEAGRGADGEHQRDAGRAARHEQRADAVSRADGQADRQ